MIKVLPSHIANLIAAGEVVQRPSSVVKELMENAVDAGATQIVLIANDSGRTLIQVIDNGTGMTKEEAEICFERHATSKIAKAEDLYSINTFGFRGEALASIAACADVTLKTRKEGEETGTEIHIAENKIISSTTVSTPQGCNFAVRNIFYNIPARRKFLKSDNVEYRQIVGEFTKVALTRPDIEFKFIHNSKEIYTLPAVANLKQRITQIAGRDIAKDLIDIQTDTTVVAVRGFVGRPSLAKKNQPNQYFFVNGRFFKSPLLHKAVLKAYTNLIPDGSFPSYFIFLNIEPGNMDVNIHPSKTEIKFENDVVIFEILSAAVKEAIGEGAFIPSIDFDTEGAPEIPAVPHDTKYVAPPKINFDPLFNPFKEELNARRMMELGATETAAAPAKSYFKEQSSLGGVFGEEPQKENIEERPLIQIRGRYIITTVKSGLLVIDINRAKERILYERYLNSMTNAKPAIQENLFPQTIDLDHSSYTLLMENPEKLKEIGFDIRPFGTDCIVVYGLPSTLADEQLDIKECIDTLIADLSEIGKDFDAEFKSAIALKMVRASRRGGNQAPGQAEAQGIIDSLFACSEPHRSPSGDLCMSIITLEELAGRF